MFSHNFTTTHRGTKQHPFQKSCFHTKAYGDLIRIPFHWNDTHSILLTTQISLKMVSNKKYCGRNHQIYGSGVDVLSEACFDWIWQFGDWPMWTKCLVFFLLPSPIFGHWQNYVAKFWYICQNYQFYLVQSMLPNQKNGFKGATAHGIGIASTLIGILHLWRRNMFLCEWSGTGIVTYIYVGNFCFQFIEMTYRIIKNSLNKTFHSYWLVENKFKCSFWQ